ncbi:L-seryl-tRNA(Sec) selenium transferase [soil metagenome]
MADLRDVPKVDKLAASVVGHPESVRNEAARQAISEFRAALLQGEEPPEPAARAQTIADEIVLPSLRPVINMTGVVLHTGLGRARLHPEAAEAARRAADHSALEFDLATGERGDRQAHVCDLLTALTGAEDAMVVNNAAGATVLVLAALCAGEGVALSRGQMVEIGGSFRLPEIIEASGARLVEVGCTNRTRLSDYESALEAGAKAILRCHPSNYRIVGFTAEPSRGELAELAHSRNALYIDDQGSGCLVDTLQFGLPRQETLTSAISEGADLAFASGDKLLGGPQAGLLVGRRDLVQKCARHPLARALRPDKMTLAALEATLRLYRDGREDELPTLRYLVRTPEEVRALAETIGYGEIVASQSEVGAGSAPGTTLPAWCVALDAKLAAPLRQCVPPIIGRISQGRLLLDPRTVEKEEILFVQDHVKRLLEDDPR